MLIHILSLVCLYGISTAKNLYTGDLSVANNLIFSQLHVNNTFQCRNLLMDSLDVNTLLSRFLIIDDMYTEEIANPGDNYIILEGSLNVRGGISWDPKAGIQNETFQGEDRSPSVSDDIIPELSYLQIDSLVLGGIKQWTILDHENFDSSLFLLEKSKIDVNGWSARVKDESDTQSIASLTLDKLYDSNDGDRALFTKHTNIIFKQFTNLPTHSSIMVEAQLLIYGPSWNGEAVFAKVDNKIVWFESYDSAGAYQDYETIEPNWNRMTVAFSVNHYDQSLMVEFGTNKEDSDCLGFDDFILSIK